MNNGKCYICNDIYKDGGMARHIKSCLKKTKGAKTSRDEANDNTYLIKVKDKYDSGYYLYLLIDGCVFLSEIDQYIRDIWVECCGHLSCFTIDGIRYERYPDDEWEKTEDMSFEIGEVLYPDASFYYEYDYGSTTELELKVMEIYEPLFSSKGIYLIGRNMPRKFKCDFCDNEAKLFFEDAYLGEQGVVCNSCIEKMQSGHEETYFLDIINSPRLGVCGYDSPADDIMFMEHKGLKKRKRKKTAVRQKDTPALEGCKLAILEKIFGGEQAGENKELASLMHTLQSIENAAKYKQRSMPPFMIERSKLDGRMLKNYLSALRKNELDIIIKNLNMERASGAKKHELVEHISKFMLGNIENILTCLHFSSYTALMEINKAEDAFYEEDEDIPEILDDLRKKGLLFTVCEDEAEYEWVIPDDIKIILEKLKSNEDFQKRRVFSDKINKTIVSIFYYWGIVSKYDLMKETARLLGVCTDDEFIEVFDSIFNNIGAYTESERIGKKVYYYLFAEDAGAKILSSQWQDADYPLIKKDMIPKGNEGWIGLVLHNPYFKWIYDVMDQGNNEEVEFEEDAYELVSTMAQVSLNVKPGTDARQLADELEMQDEVFGAPFMRELLSNILSYTPNYWIKGNSVSGEIHVNNDQFKGWGPHITPLKSPAKSQGRNSVETAASRWKVGRNDPCPCGSGKKYKKCCGK